MSHANENTSLLHGDDHSNGHHHRSLTDGVAAEGESGRSGFQIKHFLHVTWLSSNPVAKYVNLLWPFVIVAIIVRFVLPGHPLLTFAMAYVGMVPAANLIGFAGQELARKLPKVSGILIETALGGIVEILLFMILLGRHKPDAEDAEEGNLVPVIQAAILGSILTNLLLCLGLCFFVGGIRHVEQQFHASVSEVGTGLLLVAGFGLLIPSAFYSALKSTVVREHIMGIVSESEKYTQERLDHDIMRISQITSIFLILAFVVYIWFNARTNHSIFDEVLETDEAGDADRAADMQKPKLTFTECVVALVISLALVTLLAVFLVEQIEHVVHSGVPDQFLGLILLPLVEKAAEHLTAIDEAWDGTMVGFPDFNMSCKPCDANAATESCPFPLPRTIHPDRPPERPVSRHRGLDHRQTHRPQLRDLHDRSPRSVDFGRWEFPPRWRLQLSRRRASRHCLWYCGRGELVLS